MIRRSLLFPAALTLGIALVAGGLISPPSVSAASCVRFSASNFDAPGNDNYNTNGEWVRIRNYCSTRRSLSGWVIHDYLRKHVYRFPTGVSIRPGYSITLYTGRGTNTTTRRYWGRSYGAVWNNRRPEFAYLRNASGTQLSRWTEY